MDASRRAFRTLQPFECHQIKSVDYSITGDVVLIAAGNAQVQSSFQDHSKLKDKKNVIDHLSFEKFKIDKQVVSHEITTQQLLFECSHSGTSSTDIKHKTTLYSIVDSTTGKNCSVGFI